MNARLFPGAPGYGAAIAALLAKAQRRDPRFRIATHEERASLYPTLLFSFSGTDGSMVAPVFVLELAPGRFGTREDVGKERAQT